MAGTDDMLIALAGAGDGGVDRSTIRQRLDALLESSDGAGPVAHDPPGRRNQRLLDLHARLCRTRLEACAPCPVCGERNEFDVPQDELLELAGPVPDASVELGGARFRLPRMADLDALDLRAGAEPVAWQLARTCLIRGDTVIDAALVEALGRAFDAADPAADVTLSLDCADCGHHFPVSIDLGLLVGDALVRMADGLLRDVDTIAAAYGWTEGDILALPRERRRRYVAMIAARRVPGTARPRLVDLPR